MRQIDADALIAELNESHFPGAPYVDAGISIAIGKVLDAPTIEPERQWISCKDGEPEEYGEYRITWTTSVSKKRFIGDAEYEVSDEWDAKQDRFKGEWILDDYIKNYPDVKVIAWKPLEEPYMEEGDQDERGER